MGDFIELEAETLSSSERAGPCGAGVSRARRRAEGVVFTPGVASAHEMTTATAASITAATVDGTWTRGAADVLASNSVASPRGLEPPGADGVFDEPSIDCIIIARPTKSRPRTRKWWKARALVRQRRRPIPDLVGATTYHSLITAASLFGGADALTGERPRPCCIIASVPRSRTNGHDSSRMPSTCSARGGSIGSTRDETFIHGRRRGLRHRATRGDAWTAIFYGGDQRERIAESVPLAYAQGAAEDFARRHGAPLLNPQRRGAPGPSRSTTALRRFRVQIPPTSQQRQ